MKVSYNWLKDYIDFDMSPSDLAERLTMLGLEVESLKELGRGYEGVVVGRVLSKKGHPNADKLSICQVDVGSGKLSIVCGAPNVEEGQKVPVALIGTELRSGVVIERARIRDVDSEGMICSEAELGLGEDTSGIMVLPQDAQVGAPLSQALSLDDVIMDLEVTPNRPDCLSLIGVAREAGVITGEELRLPGIHVEEGPVRASEMASVEIEDPEGCPRYSARVVTDVRVGPSPEWLERRLEAAGLRPINNVVDVTNYVLMEMGHPMHAFDLDKLVGRKIIVRRAREGERLMMLDGIERGLDQTILVIADGEKAVAVAGLMGGIGTGVSEGTKDVLLESAYFSPSVIRAGARKLNLSTEASYRFERGADFNATVLALDRAAQLIVEIAGGAVSCGVIDAYPQKMRTASIDLRVDRVNRILGTSLDQERIVQILDSLGCRARPEDGRLRVGVPSFRPDLTREIDLVEEVARVYGYNEIESREIAGGRLAPQKSPEEKLATEIRDILTALGLTEVVTNSLVDPKLLEVFDPNAEPIRISNPPSQEMTALRTTLLPSLLEVARRNLNYKVSDIRMFELGRVFYLSEGFAERLQVGGLLIGSREEPYWDGEPEDMDFFDLKGLLETCLARISPHKLSFEDFKTPIYESGSSAQALLNGEPVGIFGKLNPELVSIFDISESIYAFLLDFQLLLKHHDTRKFCTLPKYPAVQRDIALIVDEATPSGQVVEAVLSVDQELIKDARVFDLYRGDQVPIGQKGLALSIKFQSKESTLSESEVEGLCARILDKLERDFGAKLRSLPSSQAHNL